MSRKKHEPEEIVARLRQVGVLVSRGRSVAGAVRSIGVAQLTCSRWRKEFGGLQGDRVKRLKEREKENGRLRKAVSGLTPEKLILRGEACGRTPRATSRPRASPCLHRAGPAGVPCLGAPRLPRARPASLDPSRKVPRGRADEEALTAGIVALAARQGRCGQRRIPALLGHAGRTGNVTRGAGARPASTAAGG
ncbi:transposase [Paracoccus sp. MC1862]|nr:transposase [Paracoccus sp. MC1862]